MKKRREAIITVAPLACLVLAVLLGVGSYTVSVAMGGFAVFMLIASFVLSLVNAILLLSGDQIGFASYDI